MLCDLRIFALDTKTLGNRIKEARERRGLSQEALAEAVLKDQGAISEYETGKRRLPAVDLPLFATALEVPIAYFFEPIVDTFLVDAAMLNYLHQLPTPEDQRAAVDIVRILSERLRGKRP